MAKEPFKEMVDRALSSLAEKTFFKSERKAEAFCSVAVLLAILPTDFGKRLIFHFLALRKENACVPVTCPLISIVDEQILKATTVCTVSFKP